jgi:hypothetical protein
VKARLVVGSLSEEAVSGVQMVTSRDEAVELLGKGRPGTGPVWQLPEPETAVEPACGIHPAVSK